MLHEVYCGVKYLSFADIPTPWHHRIKGGMISRRVSILPKMHNFGVLLIAGGGDHHSIDHMGTRAFQNYSN